MRTAGAIGNFLGYYIGRDAEVIDHPVNRRVIGLRPPRIRQDQTAHHDLRRREQGHRTARRAGPGSAHRTGHRSEDRAGVIGLKLAAPARSRSRSRAKF